MALSRRTLMLSGGALLGSSAFAGFQLRPQGFVDIGRAVLERVFGPVAVAEAGEDFLRDADAFLRRETQLHKLQTLHLMQLGFGVDDWSNTKKLVEDFMIQRFAISSTVVAASETGEPVEYIGFFDPYSAPCSNQLSAFNAPV